MIEIDRSNFPVFTGTEEGLSDLLLGLFFLGFRQKQVILAFPIQIKKLVDVDGSVFIYIQNGEGLYNKC